MRETGCSLARLELSHPEPQGVTTLLSLMGLQHSIRVSGIASSDRPFLIAHLNTPHGVRTIGGT